MSLQLQVIEVSYKLDRIDNLFIIEEHTSDLACIAAVLLLYHRVDSITNLLPALLWLSDLCKLLHVDENWLSLRLLLLSHHSLLLRGLHAHLLLLMWHGLHPIILLSWHLTTRSSLLHAPTSLVWFSSASTLASSTLIVLSSLILLLSALSSHLPLTVHLHWFSVWPELLLLTLWLHHAEIFHEVLLNLLEAPLFAFLMQFRSWNPELYAQGSCSEWCGLVKLLDSSLCTFNVLEEHEVLSVCS